MGEDHPPPHGATRWELIRDIAVFQLKVGIDALRDLALVPVSLVAGLVDLVSGGDRPGRLFYDVLEAGRRTEDWINLFGDLDNEPTSQKEGQAEEPVIDSVVARLENLIVEQYERGGMTASAKDAIDRSLNAFSSKRNTTRGLTSGEESDH